MHEEARVREAADVGARGTAEARGEERRRQEVVRPPGGTGRDAKGSEGTGRDRKGEERRGLEAVRPNQWQSMAIHRASMAINGNQWLEAVRPPPPDDKRFAAEGDEAKGSEDGGEGPRHGEAFARAWGAHETHLDEITGDYGSTWELMVRSCEMACARSYLEGRPWKAVEGRGRPWKAMGGRWKMVGGKSWKVGGRSVVGRWWVGGGSVAGHGRPWKASGR